ncbi:hypothetical protein FA95DRAFT_1553554 [Auriscalpium vulgare]|uniref:Uncharacterized protein n=1 Tax=Auriscalpium vulgare TaxID=40419 RepID=A0ACB8S8Q0_9AGAM|nr:hypothetical protein FA95DRAFT_1553554 [Auriscalpium vulgare]
MSLSVAPVPPTPDAMSPIAEEYPPDSPSTSTARTQGVRLGNSDASPDPFRRTIRRRRSRLEQWLDDQYPGQSSAQGSAKPDRDSNNAYAYLAYPALRRPRSPSIASERASTIESFVLVDSDSRDGEDDHDVFESRLASPPQHAVPHDAPSSRPYSALFTPPASLRAFHLSLSPARRTSTVSSRSTSSPRTPLHTVFNRQSTLGHSRGLSAGSMPVQPSTPQTPSSPRSTRSFGTWKFRRPSVFGAFAASDAPVEERRTHLSPPRTHLSPPRPSFSSSHTFSSGTTGTSTELSTPHKNPTSIRLPSPALQPRTASSSLWSLPSDASHMHDPPDSDVTVSMKPGTIRLPFSLKAHGNTIPTLRHVPSMLPVPRDKRKKRLVVSGIAVGDDRRYAGVKQWCESFGEVNTITRMPNGDLHVDFRKAEVADTVCRINARVHISRVGSVSLSWYTGKKP